IPHHGSLPLVGDADRGHPVLCPAQLFQHCPRGRQHGGPDDFRVVLHPARGRVDRLERLLLRREDLARGREGHGAARARALVDGEENVAHEFGLRSGYRAISARVTPLVQPNPSCSGYSPPPPGRFCSTSYFSTSLPVWSKTRSTVTSQRRAISRASAG